MNSSKLLILSEQMPQKDIVVARAVGKDNKNIVIKSSAIYERQDIKSSLVKILQPDTSLKLRILQIVNVNQKQEIKLRLSSLEKSVDFIIDSQSKLETTFKLIGKYSAIQGLQQLLVSFKKVGQGAFAQVYEGITKYEQKFALKMFEKKSFIQVQKSREAFNNQIRLLKKLSNPFIVSFDYLFQTDKAFYLKMEYFQASLKDKMMKKMLIKQQKMFMKQLLIALTQMKKQKIIHRDLKPDNVMIRTNSIGQNQCVIIDFGLATSSDVKQYLFARCGTPGFLAPQIANMSSAKEKQTCAVDMFSLGCIFFKMLTGSYLFGGKTAQEILRNNRKCIYDDSVLNKISADEKSLLLKMIQADPTKRITPEQALKEPYFKQDIDDCDQIPEQECSLSRQLFKIRRPKRFKSMDSLRFSQKSLSLTQSNQSYVYRNGRLQSIKDSCLTFQCGNLNCSAISLKKSNVSTKSRGDKLRQSRFSQLYKKNTGDI